MELVVVRTGQHQFSEVVRDYLKRITYGADGSASWVRLPSYQRAEVIVDPTAAQIAAMTAAGAAEAIEALPYEVRFGDDVAALQPVIQGPALQVLPLAICA